MSIISYGAPITVQNDLKVLHALLCSYQNKIKGSCVFQMWQRAWSWFI